MELIANIKAGTPERMQIGGSYLAVLDVTGAASFGLVLRAGGQVLEELSTARRGITLDAPQRFQDIELSSPVACTVRLIVSDGRVRVGTIDGATVNVTATAPLPVANDRGTPGNLLHVAGVTLADAPATSITTTAPVACSSTAATLATANASRRALRFINFGPDPVAIGPTGQTWANRAVVLEPGDIWIEDRAANLAWQGVTDTGMSASVGVQGILA